MNHIVLIQPRHTFAPSFEEKKIGHVYLPTSLISVASILINSGNQVSFIDENIDKYDFKNNIVGINLLGAPYIPTAIEFSQKMRNKFGDNYHLLIGGQVIDGLTKEQFSLLFGKNAINGNNTKELSTFFGLKHNDLLPVEKISFVDGYNLITHYNFKLYLKNELGFYLSQGCKYSCTFCGAKRNKINVKTNLREKCVEKYRNIDIAIKDIEFLVQKAIYYNIHELHMYLSNLDLFQSPHFLSEFVDRLLLLESRYIGFQINFRALATVTSFLKVHETCPELLLKLIKSGLYRIGFGVDGASPIVWKKTKKPHTKSGCINAIKIIKEQYGITPEILMVFGYDEFDTEKTLKLALEFAYQMNVKYGAIPRPHVAKDFIPGSDNWNSPEYSDRVKALINNPDLFLNLDFTSLPSEITHTDEKFRCLISKYYMDMCSMPDSLTQYIKPINIGMSDRELFQIKEFNLGRYDF